MKSGDVCYIQKFTIMKIYFSKCIYGLNIIQNQNCSTIFNGTHYVDAKRTCTKIVKKV